MNEILKKLLNEPNVVSSLSTIVQDSSTQSLSELFQCAAENGHTEVVRLLLADSRVNPAARDNWPIEVASENGYRKIVRLLLADPRVTPQNKQHKIMKHNLIRNQAIVLNQLPYGPYGRLPALITSTILSFVYNIKVKELYDDMAKIKKSIDKIKYENIN